MEISGNDFLRTSCLARFATLKLAASKTLFAPPRFYCIKSVKVKHAPSKLTNWLGSLGDLGNVRLGFVFFEIL
jgi:hypothetical protein